MASSEEQSSILEGELTCPVCLDLFKDPHLLPCGHNFCLVCVRRLKRQSERGRFRCPECRESHRCSSEPLKNFKLANIADSLRSKARTAARPPAPPGAQAQFPARTPASVPCDYCPAWGSEAAGKGAEAAAPEPGCEGGVETKPSVSTGSMAVKTCLKCEVSMCQEHVRPHLELPAFRAHLLTEPLADLRNRKCMEHDEMFRYYCMDDKVCVCNACTIEGHHSGHTIKTLKNTMKDLKGSLERQLHKVERKLSKAERTFQEIQDEERNNKKFQEDSEERVTALGEVLSERLGTFLASLRECSRSHCSAATPSVQGNQARVGQDQVRLQELRCSIEGLLEEKDPFRFLEGHKASSKRHRSQMKKPLFVPNYARLDMDTLGNDLEDKLKDFLCEVRTHVNDAIDSLCPVAEGEGEEDELVEDEDEEEEEDDQGEEMPSEGEEEEEEEGHDQTESADELFSPEEEDEEEEDEEDEEDFEEEEGI
ncbi:E3 ubiquitin/ISG15 ligase TRIM25 [Osmerus mordax]|uniref:E3 ubiquitin/ISG15 ligase TRIM25 n=1 Tax=Osmerus mordax TaxID=8014 RepID=UPI00350EC8F4